MGLIYDICHWLDHVTEYPTRRKLVDNGDGTYDLVKAQGKVIQQGTLRNAAHYNNIETGILANQLMALQTQQQVLQLQRAADDLIGEYGSAKLSNTRKYPFNNSGTTVALTERRTTTDYWVELIVTDFSGGLVENVEVYDKQTNGFKIRFTGSAASVTVEYCIKGGKYQ